LLFLVSSSFSTNANSLWLAVANACRRLSEDQLDRPFDPFYRVEDVQETATGLGLAITRKIVERNAGRIRAINSQNGSPVRDVVSKVVPAIQLLLALKDPGAKDHPGSGDGSG
jgi:signal transduction histidine kinase